MLLYVLRIKFFSMDFKVKIREIPDYPKKGVSFKDITPLLEDGRVFKLVINKIAAFGRSQRIEKVVGVDARGFLLASAVAYRLGVGLAIVRKKGKLPSKVIACEYDLEYGKDIIEIHQGAIKPRERVLIVDDVLATGGTAAAAVKLVKRSKGQIVGLAFLIDLTFLKGKKKLKKYQIFSLISY